MFEVRRRMKTVALGIALLLLLLEIALRFFPVSTGLRPQTVDAEHPVFRFEASRSYVTSHGWNFRLANRGWINNDGFVSDHDYLARDATPLLAIVGDSFIEAQMVPYAETAQGRLSVRLAGRVRVYSFAAAGAPLTQYLVWSEYARTTYSPDALVISVVANDFDGSLADYGIRPGQHHFVWNDQGDLELRRFDFTPNPLFPILRATALGRYVYLNLALPARLDRLRRLLRAPGETETRFVANTESAITPERLRDSERVIDHFFRLLPEKSGFSPDRILFVIDGLRPDLYDDRQLEAAETSYFALMRTRFMEKARSLSYEVVDLQPLFIEHHRRTGERSEFPTDNHWNGTGHGVVAEAIGASDVLRQWRR